MEFVGPGVTISRVNFEICRVWKTSRKNQPYMCVSSWAKCSGSPYRTALCPRGNFPSCNHTKILSHLRTPEQGQWELTGCSQNHDTFQATQALLGPSLSQSEPISGCPSLLPGAPAFSGIGCTLALATSPYPSPLFRFGYLKYCHPSISYLGWGSKCCVLSFSEVKRVQSLV